MKNITAEDIDRMFIIKRGCAKCKHQWFPRTSKPQRCPKCQTWLDKWTGETEEDGFTVE